MRLRPMLLAAIAVLAALPAVAAAQSWSYGPEASPPGANDFACVPSAEHPNPVVLVHGLGANMAQNWGYISPRLEAEGYCVFALTYGRSTTKPAPFDQPGGIRPMEESAAQLAAFIDRVLAATGAEQVDVVGHSEGSLMPNHYLRFMDEARRADGGLKVARYVGMTPLWDGTDIAGIGTLAELAAPFGGRGQAEGQVAQGCASCPQFVKGSDFIRRMNSGDGPRVPGVDYTMIMTRYDELVVPYTSGIMDGANNIVVQDQCAADPAEHLAVAFDPIVLRDVLNALDPAHAEPVDCTDLFDA